jgi:hypothetical protein
MAQSLAWLRQASGTAISTTWRVAWDDQAVQQRPDAFRPYVRQHPKLFEQLTAMLV